MWSGIGREDGSSGTEQWIAGALMVLGTRPSSAVALPVVAGTQGQVGLTRAGA